MRLDLRAADAYCRVLTSGHYENFVVSFPGLHADLRRDLARFYAFCRTTDDFGDESGPYARSRLARWRAEVEAVLAGEPATHPVMVALGDTIARRTLPPQPFLDLIAANEQDQEVATYGTWPQLEGYCMLSAAPVGRIVLRLFGIESTLATQLSDDVCIGLQLANHAQDVSRDARIGRTYLVASDIAAGGVHGAVKAMCDRARELLASGERLEGLAPVPLRMQLALYRLGGLAICRQIERIGYATERERPSVEGWDRLRVVGSALVRGLMPRGGIRNVEPA